MTPEIKEIIREEVEKTYEDKPERKKREAEAVAAKIFEEGVPAKEAMGLSDEMLEAMYAHGYRLYNAGKYKDASQMFRSLLLLDATEPKYLMGLAACFHLLKEYDMAIKCYQVTAGIDADNPLPLFYCADCLIKQESFALAALMLKISIDRAGDREEFTSLKARAAMMAETLCKDLPPVEKTKE